MIPEGQKTEVGVVSEEDHTYSVKVKDPVPETRNQIEADAKPEAEKTIS